MRKLAIVMALSSTVLAAPALARDGVPYAGAEFGAMIVEDLDFDIGTTQDALSVDHDYGYDGAIFAGYDLGAFRVEVEASQKRADVDSIQTGVAINAFGRNNRDFDPGVGRTKVQSLMLNGMLDFGDDGWDGGVSGFVGGGVGLARTSVRAGAFSNLPGVIDDRDSQSFAWQVIAGVRQALTPNVDAHLKYRFFNTKPDFEGTAFPNLTGETDTRIRTHSLLGGLTFHFGAPPVVVVPPPPPPVYVAPPPPPVETQVCPNGTVIPVTQTCPPPPPPPVVPRAGERG